MAERRAKPVVLGTNLVTMPDGTGLFGPFDTAKTTALCRKAWLYAQAFPGAKIAIVRDTWPNLRDTTMATFFSWYPPGVLGEHHKTKKVFTLRTNGRPSQILFRALDDEKDVRNVLSLELAAAALDEPWVARTPRVAATRESSRRCTEASWGAWAGRRTTP